jgi:predicted DNA-binding transcriptional regulator AlpA
MDKLLDIRDVAEATGLAVQTLRNMRVKNEGPQGFLLRGRLRYYASTVTAWIEAEAASSSRK